MITGLVVKVKKIYGYVYMVENIKNEKMYIGQTININKRMSRHKSNCKNGVKTNLYNEMREYGIDNFIYHIIEEEYSKEGLEELEKYYIELYDTCKGYGYNMITGGSGFPKGKEHPLFSVTGKDNHNYGRKHSDDWKSEHSKRMTGEGNSFFGKKHSDETKKKLSKSNKGKKITAEQKKKMMENRADTSGVKNGMARAIVQLSIDGVYIAEYPTVKQGAQAVNGDSSSIVACCRNKAKSSYGYKWLYADDYQLN